MLTKRRALASGQAKKVWYKVWYKVLYKVWCLRLAVTLGAQTTLEEMDARLKIGIGSKRRLFGKQSVAKKA